MLVLVLVGVFLLLYKADPSLVTGFAVKQQGDKAGIELNQFYYDIENNEFYIVIAVEGDKGYVAKLYPKVQRWQEMDMYIFDDTLHIGTNEISEVLLVEKDFLPEGSVDGNAISLITIDGEVKTYII